MFYRRTNADWRWQWVSPQENRWKNIKTSEEGRHHVHETILQRAVKEAVREAGVVKSSTLAATPSDIRLPPICLRPGTTSEPSRN